MITSAKIFSFSRQPILLQSLQCIFHLNINDRRKSRGHLIRYYGLYSSRSRGKASKDGSLDKFGWGARSEEEPKKEQEENPVETLSQKKSKQTWARLIKKIYEVDPTCMDALVSAKPWMARADHLSVLNVVLRWLCWPLLQTLKK